MIALALAAFSVPWSAQEIAEIEMPEVAPPDDEREAGTLLHLGAPPFTSHIVLQRRIGPPPFTPSEVPMEIGGWLGLAEPRPIDAISLAFFSDALFSPPYTRLTERATTPTVDLTVHFRTSSYPRARSRRIAGRGQRRQAHRHQAQRRPVDPRPMDRGATDRSWHGTSCAWRAFARG